MSSSATHLSAFQCADSYQPPLFPSWEMEASCHSALGFICRCQQTWTKARSSLLCAVDRYTMTTNRHCSLALAYQVGWKVNLSTRDIPLQMESSKLAPRFIGPFEIQKIINYVAVRLKLLNTMKIHSTFHVSRLKLVHESPPAPVVAPPPPSCLIDGGVVYAVRCLL